MKGHVTPLCAAAHHWSRHSEVQTAETSALDLSFQGYRKPFDDERVVRLPIQCLWLPVVKGAHHSNRVDPVLQDH